MLLKISAEKLTDWCYSEIQDEIFNKDVVQYGIECFWKIY